MDEDCTFVAGNKSKTQGREAMDSPIANGMMIPSRPIKASQDPSLLPLFDYYYHGLS